MRVAVLGAGGRAGRAISQEFLARGHRVTGLVRDAHQHASLRDLGVEVVEGDATRAEDLGEAVGEADVVVIAVTPFSAPPESFDGFDEAFYERVLDAVLGSVRTVPATRLITVGLFGTVTLSDGRIVMDDPDLFPPQLRPFARAHARELPALHERATGIDWLIVTPPAGLQVGPQVAAGYALADLPLAPDQVAGRLSYAQLAQAIADQAENPTVHNAQVAVLAVRE